MKSSDQEFKDFVLDQLQDLPGVQCRPMFGGYGIYVGDSFFGILFAGELFFKTNTKTRGAYEAFGMKPFRPSPKQTLKNYYQVPADILEDAEELVKWAKQASLA